MLGTTAHALHWGVAPLHHRHAVWARSAPPLRHDQQPIAPAVEGWRAGHLVQAPLRLLLRAQALGVDQHPAIAVMMRNGSPRSCEPFMNFSWSTRVL
jgi:hypothetical protein